MIELKHKLIDDYALLRAQRNMSQKAFWGRLGVSSSAGGRYEGGRKIPLPVAILAYLVYVKGIHVDAKDFE